MSPRLEPGEGRVARVLHPDREAVVVRADIGGLFRAYLDHVQRWESLPDGLSQTMMRQALGAAAMHIATRPRDETVAWTLNVTTPPLNLFFTAHGGDSTVAGRVYTEGVKTIEVSRLFVETSRPGQRPVRSTITVSGLDVLEIFEQYYELSEQTTARFLEESEHELVMVLALPDADHDWIRSLDRDGVGQFVGEAGRRLDERVFRFQCGCSSPRMLELVRALYEDEPESLFLGEKGVETFCPRCGRRWWILRKDF